MLQQLLQALQTDRTLTTDELAKQLQTTPQMVVAMLEYLEKSGLLKKIEACDEDCGGCQLANICSKNTSPTGKFWQV